MLVIWSIGGYTKLMNATQKHPMNETTYTKFGTSTLMIAHIDAMINRDAKASFAPCGASAVFKIAVTLLWISMPRGMIVNGKEVKTTIAIEIRMIAGKYPT
mmetsp:Transcript_6440/g.7404  ORF Transcript_6440/g.7404 Transcript_6440/m.7404 type:complete len:101 (+) Transcript_6440:247-549(+)